MTDELFLDKLNSIDYSAGRDRAEIIDEIAQLARDYNYPVVEAKSDQPWGGSVQLDPQDSQRFAAEFFPEIDGDVAPLSGGAQLIIIAPGQRLDWQSDPQHTLHWKFLTSGKYFLSDTDQPGMSQLATVGTSLAITPGQYHQLLGLPAAYMAVATIRQPAETPPVNTVDSSRP